MSDQEEFETIPRPLGREFFERLGMSADDVFDVPNEYRDARIPKRSGGYRQLSIPCADMLALQRKLNRSVLRHIPDAHYSKGFKRSLSIANHAVCHVGKKCVIRFDIRNFFGSIQWEKVRETFRSLGWNERPIGCLLYICAHPFKPGLPQGAATSPVLSNIVNRKLDFFLAEVARAFAGAYTRYADDLTFSFPYRIHRTGRKLEELKARVRSTLAAEGYALNDSKTVVMGNTNRQVVTGLVVNDKPALARDLRRRLRAAEHRHRQGRQLLYVTGPNASRPMNAEQFRGWMAFRSMIENTDVRKDSEGSCSYVGVWQVPQTANGALTSTNCTDQDLLELPRLLGDQWVELALSRSAVTDAGLRSLRRLPNLKVLRLDHTAITDDGVKQLAGLRHLRELDLSNTRIGYAGLSAIRNLASLESLSVRNTAISQAGWQYLKALSRLQHLDISGARHGDAAAGVVCELPALTHLIMSYANLTSTGTECLNGHDFLQVLDVSHNPVDDKVALVSSTLPRLLELNLSFTQITDAAVEHLASCGRLRNLNVTGSLMTLDGTLKLRKAIGSGCGLSDDLRVLEEDSQYEWEEYKKQAAIDPHMFLDDEDIPPDCL